MVVSGIKYERGDLESKRLRVRIKKSTDCSKRSTPAFIAFLSTADIRCETTGGGESCAVVGGAAVGCTAVRCAAIGGAAVGVGKKLSKVFIAFLSTADSRCETAGGGVRCAAGDRTTVGSAAIDAYDEAFHSITSCRCAAAGLVMGCGAGGRATVGCTAVLCAAVGIVAVRCVAVGCIVVAWAIDAYDGAGCSRF